MSEKQADKLLPWPRYAERKGVTTRTLDRWVEAGILRKPDVINGRKYLGENDEPRRDGEKNA